MLALIKMAKRLNLSKYILFLTFISIVSSFKEKEDEIIISEELTLYKEIFINTKKHKKDYGLISRRLEGKGNILFVDTLDFADPIVTYKNIYTTDAYAHACPSEIFHLDSFMVIDYDTIKLQMKQLEKSIISGDTIFSPFYACGYQVCFIPYKIKLKYIKSCGRSNYLIPYKTNKKRHIKNDFFIMSHPEINIILNVSSSRASN